jgi:hypothetical protein
MILAVRDDGGDTVLGSKCRCLSSVGNHVRKCTPRDGVRISTAPGPKGRTAELAGQRFASQQPEQGQKSSGQGVWGISNASMTTLP